jgi:hypothetical protein
MTTINEGTIYLVSIKSGVSGELSYQVNPELTVGLNPRNDIVLNSPKLCDFHLKFIDHSGDLSLILLGKNETTLLNGKNIFINQKYFLQENDVIKIDYLHLKILKTIGIKKTKLPLFADNNQPSLPTETLKNQSKKGINFLKEYEIEALSPHPTKPGNVRTIKKYKNYLRRKKKNNILNEKTDEFLQNSLYLMNYRKITNLILGLILDFYLAYFLLSLFTNIRTHLFFFYTMLEFLALFLFQSTLFQKFFRRQYLKKISVWLLLILFLIYPLTKGSFTIPIKKVTIEKSKEINIHEKKIETCSLNYSYCINKSIDDNLLIIPGIKNKKLFLTVIKKSLVSKLELEFEKIEDIDHLNNYINRTNPFRLPLKNKQTNIEQKNEYLKTMFFNSSDFFNTFKTYGPFLSFINDTKTYFTKNLVSNIQLVNLDLNSPLIVLRDDKTTNVFFINQKKLIHFHYKRDIPLILENFFIEKVLANIDSSLLKKTQSEIGFLETFDSLPKNDFKVLYDLFNQLQSEVKIANSKYVTDIYLKSIDQVINEMKNEFRNTDPNLLLQMENIKNNFN